MPLALALILVVLAFIAGGLMTAWLLALVALVRNTEEE